MYSLPQLKVHRLGGLVAAALASCVLTNVHAQPLTGSEGPAAGRFRALQTAAILAARPRACGDFKARASADAATSGRWAEVRDVDVRQRCVRLARGQALVGANPQAVLSWFQLEKLEKAADPLGSTERELVARALAGNGEAAKAYAWFSALQAQRPIATWHVMAVHDYAVSAARVGQFEVAAICYRRLASLAAWLPVDMKVNVLVEAAAAALHTAPPHAAEALSYLVSLEREMLAPDAHRVLLVLQTVATSTLDPLAAVNPAVELSTPSGGATTLRLTEEDERFVVALGRYTESGQWPEQDGSEPIAAEAFSAPVFVALIARLRARR